MSAHRIVLFVVGVMITTVPSVKAQGFRPPVPLNTNATTDAGEDGSPRIASDGAGTWVAVWVSSDDLGGTIGTDLDILVSRSVDGGQSWSEPSALNTNANTDAGIDTEPALATDGSTWVVVWTSNDTLGSLGIDRDILTSRSVDGGATWSAPAPLNTTAGTDGFVEHDHAPQVATDGTGTWLAVWESWGTLGGTIDTDPDILSSESIDGGVTWSPPVPVNTTATTDDATDAFPSLATDGMGTWLVVWVSDDSLSNTIEFDNDLLVSRSIDNGATWSPPAVLNSYAAADGRPDQPASVATDGVTWVAVWSTSETLGGTIDLDNDILVARSTDAGLTWTSAAALNTSAPTDSGDDFAPQVATSAGTWVTVWWSTESLGAFGTDRDVLLAQSTDDGLTWTNPIPLDTTAATDAGDDDGPQLATDGAGLWVAVWQSMDTLGGTIDTDADVLVASGASVLSLGVTARKLIVVDKSAIAGPAKTAFVAKDAAITKGPGLYDDGIAVDLYLAYGDGSAQGAFTVPSGASDGTAGWRVNKSTVAKYVNKVAPDGEAQTKVAVLKPGKLVKLVAKGVGESPFDVVGAGAPTPQVVGEVIAAYCVTNEAARFCHCTTFADCAHKVIAGGTGAKLVCKLGQPDPTCTAFPGP